MIKPEHLHLALNHIPFLGAAFALIPLFLGLFQRRQTTVFAGLIIAIVSGWMTPLVMDTGESAYQRYREGPVAALLDAEAGRYLEIHEQRAETWSKVMYSSAAFSSLALVALLWRPRFLVPVASLTAMFCVATLTSGIWIAESGGSIRRTDFRKPPIEGIAPPKRPDAGSHN